MSALPRISLAQIKVHLGDLAANLASIEEAIVADNGRSDLLVFPSLALTGHALLDRWLYPHVLETVEAALPALGALSTKQAFLIGMPRAANGNLYNSACLFQQGELRWSYAQQMLPADPLLDLQRYFSAGTKQPWLDFQGARLAVTIGDEIFQPVVQQQLKAANCVLALNLGDNSFYHDSVPLRLQQLSSTASALHCPLAQINPVGGQDELVFDGHSCVFDSSGQLRQRAAGFDNELLTVHPATASAPQPLADSEALTWQALVTSVRDYVDACGFNGTLLGLSGGIDSALVLALAADALGPERVTAVMMPYHYTAQISQDDAAEQARELGVAYHVAPIAPLVEPFAARLQPLLEQWPAPAQDTTEQNLQARSRGMLLMALSNRSGALLLTTSNKSEMAVGYCTLYGDMAGGFALLKDIPKTLVYRLAEYRNTISPAIPERVITRPPSAELAPGQEDSDNLPPYPLLDEIVRLYVEENQSVKQLLAAGLDADWVQRVTRLIDRNEFKRRQAAPGPRMSKRGFGRERRMGMSGKI